MPKLLCDFYLIESETHSIQQILCKPNLLIGSWVVGRVLTSSSHLAKGLTHWANTLVDVSRLKDVIPRRLTRMENNEN